MQDRISMNTKSLQNSFPEIYKDFFVNNDIIISGCFSFLWGASWIWHRSNYLRLKSKIPLKCYIGINKISEKKIIIKNSIFYNIINNKFDEIDINNVNKKTSKILKLLEKTIYSSDFKWWIEISILSEASRWHGFGFTWTFWATLSVATYLLTWSISQEKLLDYNNFIKTKEFDEIFRLAWKMEYSTKYGNSIWDNAMNTLLNTWNPTLFLCEQFNWEEDISIIDNIKYDSYDFFQKFWWDSIFQNFPLDFCIIYSWLPSDTDKIEYFIKSDTRKFNQYENFIQNHIIQDNIKDIYIEKFIKKDSIYNNIKDTNVIYSIKTLKLFKDLINLWYDSIIIDGFIENFNEYRVATTLVENHNSFTEDFINIFNKNKINIDEKLWMIPTYSGKIWWGYLLVTKEYQSRETIIKTIEEIKENFPNLRIEYSSWIDWEIKDWVKVEQFVSEEIYSKYFDKNKLILETNKWEKILWEHGELIEKIRKGILIDSINRKVYVNGKKLTSKDIPSQATTVEILSVLLENEWKEISNNILEVSSYSKNKNDMIGKIVIPLTKLTKKHFNKEIDIVCKGSLIEFQMSLKEKDINIWIIKKIC